MQTPEIITGKTGPYNGKTAEGWGRNASVNFKNYNKGALDINKPFNMNFELQYSKPDTPDTFVVINSEKSNNKKINVNFKSLSGYASEDLKGAETNVYKNPILLPADTDNNGKITAVENAAFVLFQDALDEHPEVVENGEVPDLKEKDFNGKITDRGDTNGLALLMSGGMGKTKQTLLDIRNKFKLDQRIKS